MTTGLHPELSPEQEHALGVLKDARRIVLTGHERPDGDCIGAQAALTRVLEALGKDVTILNPDPPEARFAQLCRSIEYGADEGGPVPSHDLLVVRLGEMQGLDWPEVRGPIVQLIAAFPPVPEAP